MKREGNLYTPPFPPPHTHTLHNPRYINIHPHHPTPTSPFTISIKGINGLSSLAFRGREREREREKREREKKKRDSRWARH